MNSQIKNMGLKASSFMEQRHLELMATYPAANEVNQDTDLEKYSAFLVGAEVTYIDPRSSVQQKRDLINSKLLAQLNSNHVAGDKEKNAQAWYKNYALVLENIGYAVNTFGFTKVENSKKNLRVDKGLVELISGIVLSTNVLEGIQKSLNAVKNLEDEDGKITFFSNETNDTSGGKFQISAGQINRNGNLEVSMGCFYTAKHDTRGNFLWISWGALTFDIYASAQTLELDTEVYAAIREDINEKLKGHDKQFVKGLII